MVHSLMSTSKTFVDLTQRTISMETLKLLSVEFIRRHNVVPLVIKENKLLVAMSDPNNEKVARDVRSLTGYELEIFSATSEAIVEFLERHLKTLSIAAYTKELDFSDGAQETRTSQAIDRLFEMAMVRRASDIHLEPQPSGLFVRLRIDGVLQTIHEFPKAIMAALVSRIKIMAVMDIAEKRLPQDGQINVKVGAKAIDLRISTLPGKYGEKVVIRLL